MQPQAVGEKVFFKDTKISANILWQRAIGIGDPGIKTKQGVAADGNAFITKMEYSRSTKKHQLIKIAPDIGWIYDAEFNRRSMSITFKCCAGISVSVTQPVVR